jgi:leucyl/phenylalanyl-tRNA---protein transferase
MKMDKAILKELSPERLVLAYANGLFPMVEDGQLMWFSPDPRGVLPLDERFHVSRRLAQRIRAGEFACTVNHCFGEVVRLCADRGHEQTWISPEIAAAYSRLHELGLAHSVEAWHADAVGEGPPAGGLYGVAIGGAFFAESMFHTATDAGKVALAYLIDRLRTRGFTLCDLQWTTDHLLQFGAFDMPRQEYLVCLEKAIGLEVRFV